MDYTKVRPQIIESRVDWITCSASRLGSGIDLMNFADAMVRQHERSGDKIERYRNHGYEGYRAGGWAWGWGRAGAIAVASGKEASYGARRLALLAEHWSRVDYCVTVRDDKSEVHPDEDYWQSWRLLSHRQRAGREAARQQGTDGAATFTVGQRSSAYYARVYNKTVESEGEYPGGCWRWELELKAHASEGQHSRWIQAEPPDRYALNLIASEFNRYRLDVPWDQESTIMRDPQVRQQPDVARTLRWLERQVRPSVSFAVEEAGMDAVLEALNLPHVVYQER